MAQCCDRLYVRVTISRIRQNPWAQFPNDAHFSKFGKVLVMPLTMVCSFAKESEVVLIILGGGVN